MLKATIAEYLAALPGPVSERWPEGERFVTAMAHGTMSVELYAPRGSDTQTPHAQDELYIIQTGSGDYVMGEERVVFEPGMVLFAPAGVAHHFENFSDDFVTWVIFWGPKGGEAKQNAGA